MMRRPFVISGVATLTCLVVYVWINGQHIPRNVPVDSPTEANRVVHPYGFSIIFPPNWDVYLGDQPDTYLSANTRHVRRYAARMKVRVVNASFNLPRDSSTWVFLGRECPFRQLSIEDTPLGDPGALTFETIYDDGHRRYVLEYHVREGLQSVPDIVVDYLNTFRPISPNGNR